MIALSEPWGTVVLLIVTLSVVSAVLWRLHLHAEKVRHDLGDVIDRAEKRMDQLNDRAVQMTVDQAVLDERRKLMWQLRDRAEWFRSHEPTRRAVHLIADANDQDRLEAVAEWQRVLALHDAQAKADAYAGRTTRPKRKNK